MTDLSWSSSKSEELKIKRGVSFEDIILARLVGAKDHPSRSNQSILLFELEGHIWVVPYVIRDEEIFLKTLFPSRKYTKLWRMGALE